MAIDAAAIARMLSELRTQSRAKAEERTLDELLDRICDARGAADQDDGDPASRSEKAPAVERPYDQPAVRFLIGALIGVLAVLVLITVLALVSS
jgi:hypothetical protein